MQIDPTPLIRPIAELSNQLRDLRAKQHGEADAIDYLTASKQFSSCGRLIIDRSFKATALDLSQNITRNIIVVSYGSSSRNDGSPVQDVDLNVIPVRPDSRELAGSVQATIFEAAILGTKDMSQVIDPQAEKGIQLPGPYEEVDLLSGPSHIALRDVGFVAGNKDEFEELVNRQLSKLYDPSTEAEYTEKLVADVRSRVDNWNPPYLKPLTFIKSDIVRPMQAFFYILRTKNNDPTSRDFFQDIEKSTIPDDDKVLLKNAFEHFLKGREIEKWDNLISRGQITGEDIEVICKNEIKIDLQTFQQDSIQHLDNVKRIVQENL